MHFPSSTIIFLTVACGIATCANTWRVYGTVTLTCGGQYPLGLCLHHKGSDYLAVVASDITNGSGITHPTTHSCEGSGGALQACCIDGLANFGNQNTGWTFLSGVNFDSGCQKH